MNKIAEEILKKHIGDDYYEHWNNMWHLDNCPIDAPMTTIIDVIVKAMEEYSEKNISIDLYDYLVKSTAYFCGMMSETTARGESLKDMLFKHGDRLMDKYEQ
jgi:hypothetical protein